MEHQELRINIILNSLMDKHKIRAKDIQLKVTQ